MPAGVRLTRLPRFDRNAGRYEPATASVVAVRRKAWRDGGRGTAPEKDGLPPVLSKFTADRRVGWTIGP